jgi:hypothetical protein
MRDYIYVFSSNEAKFYLHVKHIESTDAHLFRNGIRFSRSSNYSLEMAGGGRKNIHEYIGITYTTNEASMIKI